MKRLNKIQMVDLVGQYREIKERIDKVISDVILSSKFINGPQVSEFSTKLKDYTGAGYVIPCANGTDALQIAMMALNFKPGDEVIVPAFAYVAAVEVIALLGLKPQLVDVDPDTFNIDPAIIEKSITPKTKGIVVVHLFGQAADMEEIMNIAQQNNLKVIEDNAQAIGCEVLFSDGSKKQTGTIGDIGITSFFPTKNLACYGDGGAIFTNDSELSDRIRMISSHGQKQKFHYDLIGVNSRLDTLQAAILIESLKKLSEYTLRRQKVSTYYDKHLGGLKSILIPVRSDKSTHVFNQYTLKLQNKNRESFRNYLKDNGIPTMVYYPLPMHLQKAYLHYGFKKDDFPVSEQLSEEVISIPIHTQMNDKMLEVITTTIKKYFNQYG
jgi:UDP-2-acetamido-2-deoxy-ribo-hexuluronate aminotransferase